MTPATGANTPLSVSRMARRYTIHCSLPNTHTVYIELDGGREAGGRQAGKERGRIWRVEGRVGLKEGREEAMM